MIAPGGGKRSDRLDLLLEDESARQLAAIEAKVLSDLGADQLERCARISSGAVGYWLLYLGSLPLHLPSGSVWRPLTWDGVLTAYADSADLWVAATAWAWMDGWTFDVGPVRHGGRRLAGCA